MSCAEEGGSNQLERVEPEETARIAAVPELDAFNVGRAERGVAKVWLIVGFLVCSKEIHKR